MQHDPPTDLLECLSRKYKHLTVGLKPQHALEIIRSGGDIHSVTVHNYTCLHLAIKYRLLDVVQLLLEKGIDVNAQGRFGTTALRMVCERSPAELLSELVPMLLYHGADPWIRNDHNETPLDLIIRNRFWCRGSHYLELLEAIIEHLYYYMFDQYTEFGLPLDALLKAADLDLPIFQEIIGTIKEVDLDNLATAEKVELFHILTMPPANLRLLLDRFDNAFRDLFLSKDLKSAYGVMNELRYENMYILVASNLQREFIDWLCKWPYRSRLIECLFRNSTAPLASGEEIVYCLLSYGLEIDERDIETVYQYCGYNELFKFLRFMEVKHLTDMFYLMPRLVFEVNGDIQKNIEDPWFWVKRINRYHMFDLEPALAYYAVPNLKDLCCEVVKVKRGEDFFEKLHDQPRIPLLVEMARNVFRRYFVQRLGITSTKQFYESLELLPITSHHRKIIALETELY